jgi:hypothetical protein
MPDDPARVDGCRLGEGMVSVSGLPEHSAGMDGSRLEELNVHFLADLIWLGPIDSPRILLPESSLIRRSFDRLTDVLTDVSDDLEGVRGGRLARDTVFFIKDFIRFGFNNSFWMLLSERGDFLRALGGLPPLSLGSGSGGKTLSETSSAGF